MLDQVRVLATQLRTWRHLRGQDLAHHQLRLQELEAASARISIFQPTVVPGLLQTAEYARHVFLRARPGVGERELMAAVEARVERQHLLFDTSKQLTFIIFEAALRLRICPPLVLLGQLDRIGALATSEHLAIGVLPFEVELNAIPSNSFIVFDRGAVLVETASAEIILRDERDIELYASRFDEFRSVALFKADAAAFLARLVTELLAGR